MMVTGIGFHLSPFFNSYSMFSSKGFVDSVYDIPAHWIFENYLGIQEPLNGQRVRIRSLFNPHDKTPSMYIYYNKESECYRYKCFSTGKGGSAVDLMMHMWGLPFAEAAARIMTDYGDFLKTGKRCDTRITEHASWQVSEYNTRGWTKPDADFWSSFNIPSTMLEMYNVRPLERYVMSKKMDGDRVEEFVISAKNIYGYFTKDGELYKIYQPLNRSRKFIKICDYIQGSDQLQGHKTLVICSSLKDIMSLKSLGNLNVDAIAPDSENTLIPEDMILGFKERYDAVITMMDSDEAGIRSMRTYEEKYKLPFVYLPHEKDISDIVKVKGKESAFYITLPVMQRAVERYKELNKKDADKLPLFAEVP